ncbi:MAG: trypsin-like peptidase domain-containing protein, partial [Gammaproteobacteria bacterium]|nr:trypsin-like peptidase domain-containing protein [Gammaproteobacteria bacterium]
MSDFLKSIVLVSNAEGKNFGTGFAVWRDEDQNETWTWIATCAHVLKEISRQQTDIRVDNRSASILADGASKGIDLALLRVSGSQIPILPLRLIGSENMPVSIPGYTTLISDDRKAYTLSAKLGRSGIFQRQGGGAQVDAWELLMADKAD